MKKTKMICKSRMMCQSEDCEHRLPHPKNWTCDCGVCRKGKREGIINHKARCERVTS